MLYICTDVFVEVFLDFWDVHGLSDGGVTAAYEQQAVLQRALADHDGEEDTHLVVPTHTGHPNGDSPEKRHTKGIMSC